MGTFGQVYLFNLPCPLRPLDRFQIRDDVGLFLVRQRVRIRRHAAAARIDHGEYIGVSDLLPVLELVVLVQAFQGRADLLFVGIDVVTHAALLENVFAFGGIPCLVGPRHHERRYRQHRRAT